MRCWHSTEGCEDCERRDRIARELFVRIASGDAQQGVLDAAGVARTAYDAAEAFIAESRTRRDAIPGKRTADLECDLCAVRRYAKGSL